MVRQSKVSYRAALPQAKWAAAVLFLASLAARRQCGKVAVGRFIRAYRAERRRENDK